MKFVFILHAFFSNSLAITQLWGGNSSVPGDLARGLEVCRFKSHSDPKKYDVANSWRMLVHILGIAEVPLSKECDVACVAAPSFISSIQCVYVM